MKHKMSKEALADFKEVVQHLKDNDRFYSGGDPNISAPQERWISSNAGPVIKGKMQSPPELDAAQRVEQQSVFRKVAGGNNLQEKLDKLPPAPKMESSAQNVIAESKEHGHHEHAAPQTGRSVVQDRIKEWEQRAQKRR